MPTTGPEAAKLAGLPWDPSRFKNDADYNAALGRAYLEEQMRVFGGDQVKALAAYNAGPTRVRDAVQRYGNDWLRYMPTETQDYVAKITARAKT